MKVIMAMGGGGHTAQMLELLKRLGGSYSYVFVADYGDKLTPKKLKGKVMRIHRPRRTGDSPTTAALKTIRSFFEAARILHATKADAVISAGPGIAVPFAYAAKLFGKKVVFIESWSRIYNKSTAGKLVYPIADLFFVQWPEMKKLYPKAIYAGRLR